MQLPRLTEGEDYCCDETYEMLSSPAAIPSSAWDFDTDHQSRTFTFRTTDNSLETICSGCSAHVFVVRVRLKFPETDAVDDRPYKDYNLIVNIYPDC